MGRLFPLSSQPTTQPSTHPPTQPVNAKDQDRETLQSKGTACISRRAEMDAWLDDDGPVRTAMCMWLIQSLSSAQLSSALSLSFLDAVQVHKLTQKNNKIKIKKRKKKTTKWGNVATCCAFCGLLVCCVCAWWRWWWFRPSLGSLTRNGVQQEQ